MKYLLFLVLILFSACNIFSIKKHITPEYVKMADKITAITVKKIEAETGLRLCGVGGGAIDHIRKLNLSFDCYNEITMEQGRELVVYCVNEYLTAINSNEEIRSHLIHFPFTPADIEIIIFTHKPDHRDVPMGTLCVVSERDDQVIYKIKQPDPIVLKRVHEETYEEAVKLLETEGPINKIRRNTQSNRPA